MLQFYFLSVAANLLAGLELLAEFYGERYPALAQLHGLLGRRWSRAALGAVAAAAGLLKLLLRPTPGDVRVVGDLVPALVGLALGASLLLHVAREKAGQAAEPTRPFTGLGWLEKALLTYRMPLGALGVVTAVLHFLVPGALLL